MAGRSAFLPHRPSAPSPALPLPRAQLASIGTSCVYGRPALPSHDSLFHFGPFNPSHN